MSDENIIWNYFKNFPYYLQLSLFTVKSFNANSIYTKSGKSTCAMQVYASNTNIGIT